METFEGIMGIIAIIAIVVLIGFAITWLVGILGKLATVKKVGKDMTFILIIKGAKVSYLREEKI